MPMASTQAASDPATDLTPVYEDAGKQYGIDPDYLRAQTQVESSDNPNAVSPQNAQGISQFIPSTARSIGLKDPFDPRESIPAQAKLMRENMDRFGDPALATAAYHGGTDPTKWGPKTQQYLNLVSDTYARMKAAKPQAPLSFDDLIPKDQQQPSLSFDDLIPKKMPAAKTEGDAPIAPNHPAGVEPLQPEAETPGYLATAGQAALHGALAGGTSVGQTLTGPFKDRQATEDNSYIAQTLQTPITKGWSDPRWWITQIVHGAAASSPSLAAGAVGSLAGPWGAAGGFALGSMIQELAPAYQEARAAGMDHDAAVTRAIEQTGVAGAFGAVMGYIPGLSAFGRDAEGALKRPVSEALAQIAVTMPALGAGQQVATGALQGQMPTAEELGTGYAANVGLGAGLLGLHAARHMLPGQSVAPVPPEAPAGVAEPGTPPPPPVAPGTSLENAALAELDPETHEAAAEAHADLAKIAKDEGVEIPPMPTLEKMAALARERNAQVKPGEGGVPTVEVMPHPPEIDFTDLIPNERQPIQERIGPTESGTEEQPAPATPVPEEAAPLPETAGNRPEPAEEAAPAPAGVIPKPEKLDTAEAWDQHLARFQQKLDAAQQLADAGKPMRFTDPRYPHLSYLVSPEMHEGYGPDAWRVTTFSNGEPHGHFEAKTAFDAFKEATTHDWEPAVRPEPKAPPTQGDTTPKSEEASAAPAAKPARGQTPFVRLPKEPQRLVDFIRRPTVQFPGTAQERTIPGGVRDPGGDLKAIIGGTKGRPGLINNKTGSSFNDAMLRAWEAGYFPEHGETAPNDDRFLLDKIDQDHNGQPVYSSHDQDAAAVYQDAIARNHEIDQLAAEHEIPTTGITHDQFLDMLADRVSVEELAHEMQSAADAHQAAYSEAERAAREWVGNETWHAADFFGTSQTRTLEDLEHEYQQEAPTPAASERDQGHAEPIAPAGDQEPVQGGGGPRGGGADDTGRAAPETDLLGRPVAERPAARVAEPTIRNDTRQDQMPGMEPSAVQAQAARDQTGRGGIGPGAEVKPADEGLFAPKEPDQDALFSMPPKGWGEVEPGEGAELPSKEAVQAAADAVAEMLGGKGEVLVHMNGLSIQTPEGERSVDAMALGRVIHAAYQPRTLWNLDHEVVHALRNMGLFTEREWKTLENTARRANWVQKFDVDKRWADLRGHPTQQIEEAIAEAFAAAPRMAPNSRLHQMANRIGQFFDRLRNALSGRGFQTAEDVFGKMRSGEVGSREPGSGTPERVSAASEARPPTDQDVESRLDKLGPLAKPTKGLIAMTREVGQSIADGLAPMQGGTVRSQAFAARFANALRQVQYRFGQIDKEIEHNFTPAERTKMFTALDAQSVFEQQARDIPPDQQAQARAEFDAGKTGLSSLNSAQRRTIDMLDTLSLDTWRQMQERGLVDPGARPLPYYAPRQVLRWTEEEGFTRPGGEGGGSGRGLDERGRNLTTASPMRREHLTLEETEAAAKAKLGQDVAVLRDIRSLPSRLALSHRAIAGVDLMNSIEHVGKETGVDLVVKGDIPGMLQPGEFFTMADHPSFRRWSGSGWQAIHVSKEFEGPLKAVLTKPSPGWYKAAQGLKGGVMSAIMYSPFIHLAVELGRSLPVMPGRVLTLQALRDGSRLRRDLGYMDQATTDGLSPIGQGWHADPTSIADEANVEGRNRFVAALQGMRDAVANGAKTIGGQFLHDVIQHPHQTLLWDQVFNLQVGIYDTMRSRYIEKGFDPQIAGTMAAHIANRYAGALPPEHLSRGANMAANLMLFSRSFTLGNLGVMKDMLNGAPSHVRARIEQMGGPQAVAAAQSQLRRKAIAAFTMDIGLFFMANGLLQAGIQVLRQTPQLGLPGAAQQTYQDWLDGASSAMSTATSNPLSIFGVLPQHWNEPGKQDRVYAGTDSEGRGIYLRFPPGKVGEEFLGWFGKMGTMVENKLSPIVRPIIEAIFGKDTLGRDIYKPNPQTIGDYIAIAGAVVKHIGEGLGPTSTIQGLHELFEQHVMGKPTQADPYVSLAKVIGPLTGLAQVSQGFPGGPAAGEMHAQGEREKYDLQKALPDIRDKIRNGDTEGAVADMTALKVPPALQRYYLRQTMQPGMTRGTVKKIDTAPPEVKVRVQRQLGMQQP